MQFRAFRAQGCAGGMVLQFKAVDAAAAGATSSSLLVVMISATLVVTISRP